VFQQMMNAESTEKDEISEVWNEGKLLKAHLETSDAHL
jgi:hypothetical protein